MLHAHSGLDAVRLQGPGLLEDGELTTSLVLFEADGSGRKLDMRSMPEQVSMPLRLQLVPSQQDHTQLSAWQSTLPRSPPQDHLQPLRPAERPCLPGHMRLQ